MKTVIRPLEESQFEQAFELATRVFWCNSPMHRALDVSLMEYRDYLKDTFYEMAAEGHSLVAADPGNDDRLVGCMIVCDYHRQLTSTKVADGKFAPLSAITQKLRSRFQNRSKIIQGEVALVDMGAVDPEMGGKGIYQALRNEQHRKVQSASFSRIAGELSSSATQHVVLNKLNHRAVASVPFRKFEFNQEYPFAKIEEPSEYILAIGEL